MNQRELLELFSLLAPDEPRCDARWRTMPMSEHDLVVEMVAAHGAGPLDLAFSAHVREGTEWVPRSTGSLERSL